MVPSGSLLVLVKLQLSPEQLNVKFAVGGWFGGVAVTVFEVGVLVAPPLSVTVRGTVERPPPRWLGDGVWGGAVPPSPQAQRCRASAPPGPLLRVCTRL